MFIIIQIIQTIFGAIFIVNIITFIFSLLEFFTSEDFGEFHRYKTEAKKSAISSLKLAVIFGILLIPFLMLIEYKPIQETRTKNIPTWRF